MAQKSLKDKFVCASSCHPLVRPGSAGRGRRVPPGTCMLCRTCLCSDPGGGRRGLRSVTLGSTRKARQNTSAAAPTSVSFNAKRGLRGAEIGGFGEDCSDPYRPHTYTPPSALCLEFGVQNPFAQGQKKERHGQAVPQHSQADGHVPLTRGRKK